MKGLEHVRDGHATLAMAFPDAKEQYGGYFKDVKADIDRVASKLDSSLADIYMYLTSSGA